MSGNADDEGDAQFERMEEQYALVMRAFDKVMGKSGDVEAELDPELERDLQIVIQQFLAQPRPEGLSEADLADETRLQRALEGQLRPLFEAIFTTATSHAKGAAQAIREGRDPSLRKGGPTLDLSGILEEDDT
ncbi:MAG: hypothetical protein IT385_20570 [Deltaproteobacteria bacterium]|nr:hypothetical protein [Deltaproteobacteria bacterium]